jgi:hypothetical protein
MAAPTDVLTPAWGKTAVEAPAEWLDLSAAPTGLGPLEALLRAMPDDCLYVRITGTHAGSGAPRRVALREIDDLPGRLTGASGSLHLQAIHLERHHPGCRAALESFTTRLARVIPEVARPGTTAMFGIFLSTPGAVAPFHADQEHNFLFQVTGDKHVHLFDPADLESFPSEARERLACDDVHVLDTYTPGLEERAKVFHLVPGTMIYHPPMGPHWVDTGKASHSLSVSITYVTMDVQRTLLVHKLNKRLRTLGITPNPVGRSPLLDRGKASAARMLRGMVRLTRAEKV